MLRLIQIELQERQIECKNLGAANSFSYIIEQVHLYKPKAIALSNTNGEIYSRRDELKDFISSITPVPVFLGGNLKIGDYSDRDVEQEFERLGCKTVFSRRGTIEEICDLITLNTNEI